MSCFSIGIQFVELYSNFNLIEGVIIMNLNNFTIKSQEAIQKAVEIAQSHNHQAVDTGHLLQHFIDDKEIGRAHV
jgi:hypothetical protein